MIHVTFGDYVRTYDATEFEFDKSSGYLYLIKGTRVVAVVAPGWTDVVRPTPKCECKCHG